jgi:hypothetical protein
MRRALYLRTFKTRINPNRSQRFAEDGISK